MIFWVAQLVKTKNARLSQCAAILEVASSIPIMGQFSTYYNQKETTDPQTMVLLSTKWYTG